MRQKQENHISSPPEEYTGIIMDNALDQKLLFTKEQIFNHNFYLLTSLNQLFNGLRLINKRHGDIMPKLVGRLRNIINKNTKLCLRCKLTTMQRILCYSLDFFFGASAPSGPGPPHSRGFQVTQNGAPQQIGLLWTSVQFVAETSP